MAVNRNKRPVTNGRISFKPPWFKKLHLNNSSQLYLIKKNELPIIRISFLIDCGSKCDEVNKKGTSNLTAMCIDEGAGNLNALQLADEFELLGAQFNAYSGPDVIIISLQVLSENFFKAIDLLTSVLTSPHFNENDFEREKRKIQTRVEQIKDEPDQIADIAFEYLLFGSGNPYSYPVIGTRDSLKEINAEDVRNFYRNYFNSNNTTIIAAGNFNEDELVLTLGEKFRERRTGIKPSIKLLPKVRGERKIYLLPKAGSAQTEIRIGHPTSKRSEKDYYKKLLLNLVLGGQFSSRLNLSLREKHGFTYGIHSRFNYYMDDAYFIVATSVNTENTSDALNAIFTELTKIRNGITEEELKFAKSSVTHRFPLNFETYSQIVSNFESKVIYNLPDDYFENYIGNISDVRLDELNTEAAKFIDTDNTSIILTGDEKIITSQIKEDRFGQIIKINFEEMYSVI